MYCNIGQVRSFARLSSRLGRRQHFRYGVSHVRGRWYYRYHKPIGKENWMGYKERYERPREVEAKQRLTFSSLPTYKQYRQSMSWTWRLPKMLASATSSNEVLDAWILFRHKQSKKVYHSMYALQRLVDVGGCDPTDWRLMVLLSKVRGMLPRIDNLPRLAHLYSRLGLVKQMEDLTRFILPNLSGYTGRQLYLLYKAYAIVPMRDNVLLSRCIRRMLRQGNDLPKWEVIQMINHMNRLGFWNHTVCQEFVRLLFLNNESFSLRDYADLFDALAAYRYKDLTLIELASNLCQESIKIRTFCPSVVGRLISSMHRMGVVNIDLLELVVNDIDNHLYDWPPNSVFHILEVATKIESLNELTNKIMKKSEEFGGLLNPSLMRNVEDLLTLSRCGSLVNPVDISNSFLTMTNRGKYSVGELAEYFATREVHSRDVWNELLSDAHQYLNEFEQNDFVRISGAINQLPPDVYESIEGREKFEDEFLEWTEIRKDEISLRNWNVINSVKYF